MMKMNKIQQCIKELNARYKLPSMSVAVIDCKKADYFFQKGENEYEELPLNEEMRFGIGCCTKAFISNAAARIFESFRLDFDTPVKEYCRGINFYDSYYQEHLTLKDLLSHRTGFPKQNHCFYLPLDIEKQILKVYEIYRPVTGLRKAFQYNNLSYILAGHILKSITGNGLEELLYKEILAPLNMNHTAFGYAGMSDKDICMPYIQTKDKQLSKVKNQRIYMGGAAGGLYSTIEDLTKWLLMLLDEGNDKSMLWDYILKGSASQMTADSLKSTDYLSAASYESGWFIRNYKGLPMVYHEGKQIGYTCMLSFIPQKKLGVIAMTNTHNHVAPQAVTNTIYDILLNREQGSWYRFFEVNKLYLSGLQEDYRDKFVRKYCMETTDSSLLRGIYRNRVLGMLKVYKHEENYVMSINDAVFKCRHYIKNIYCVDIYGSELLFAFCDDRIVLPIDAYENPSVYMRIA